MSDSAFDIIQRFPNSRHFFQDTSIMVHEMDVFYRPDILTISRSFHVREYEIKCSWQDFKRELDAIQEARGGDLLERPSSKVAKHRHYLQKADQGYVPNYFYFIVSKELFNKAADKGYLQGLPYGVIDSEHFFSLKRVKALHNRKNHIREQLLWEICKSYENRMWDMRQQVSLEKRTQKYYQEQYESLLKERGPELYFRLLETFENQIYSHTDIPVRTKMNLVEKLRELAAVDQKSITG